VIFPAQAFEFWAVLAARLKKDRENKEKMPSLRFELETSGLQGGCADHYTMKSS